MFKMTGGKWAPIARDQPLEFNVPGGLYMSKSLRNAGIALIVCVLFVMALAGAVATPPQAAPVQHKHLMVVVSKGLPGITLFDADTDQEICRATMGISPHEAAFSRDGKTL